MRRTTAGSHRHLELEPQSVATFYRATMAALEELAIVVDVFPRPSEVVEAIPFDQDETHRSYDRAAVHQFWLALVQVDRVLTVFRSRFVGKASPVHLFWGGADYDRDLGEFLLPYTAVRTADDPDAVLLSSCKAHRRGAATLGHWDRDALEVRTTSTR